MSVSLVVNGNLFNYPSSAADLSWGSAATGWAQAVTTGMLQKGSSGTTQLFTLLSDVNFGPNFGVQAIYYKSNESIISTTGFLRLSDTDIISWRNNANSADLHLAINGSDQLTFNGTAIAIIGNVVSGPATSTNFAIPTFNGSAGNLLRNSAVTIDASNNLSGVADLTATGLSLLSSVSGTNVQATNGTFGTIIGLGSTSLVTLSVSGTSTLSTTKVPTLGTGDSSTNAASTAFVGTAVTNAVALAVPAGCIFDFAGTTAPTGYLLCFGQALNTTTNSTLFAAIAYTFGGSGTSFNVPDYRGRVGAGIDNMGGTSANRITNSVSGITGTTLGAAGGDQNQQSHTHTATVTDPGHLHSIGQGGDSGPFPYPGGYDGAGSVNTNANVTGVTVANSTTGSGTSQNIQPTIMINKIIKT